MPRQRKPYVPNCVMGRVISIGFFYSSTGRKKDVLRVEIDLRDADQKLRKKVIDHVTKLEVMTGGEK